VFTANGEMPRHYYENMSVAAIGFLDVKIGRQRRRPIAKSGLTAYAAIRSSLDLLYGQRKHIAHTTLGADDLWRT
jgi:hypothetical protein